MRQVDSLYLGCASGAGLALYYSKTCRTKTSIYYTWFTKGWPTSGKPSIEDVATDWIYTDCP